MTSGKCGGGWTDNIPAELRTLPQWVGRCGKMPLNPLTGKGAKAGEPSTWGTFEQAILGVELGTFDGIGFEFATGGGIVGIDLDHVVNPETGEVQPWALEIVQRMDSYTEFSPSGTGLHIFVRGDIPSRGRKKTLNKDTGEAVEMYKEKRYFTVTGSPLLPAPIADRPAELAALYTELWQRPWTPWNPHCGILSGDGTGTEKAWIRLPIIKAYPASGCGKTSKRRCENCVRVHVSGCCGLI